MHKSKRHLITNPIDTLPSANLRQQKLAQQRQLMEQKQKQKRQNQVSRSINQSIKRSINHEVNPTTYPKSKIYTEREMAYIQQGYQTCVCLRFFLGFFMVFYNLFFALLPVQNVLFLASIFLLFWNMEIELFSWIFCFALWHNLTLCIVSMNIHPHMLTNFEISTCGCCPRSIETKIQAVFVTILNSI